MHPYPLGRVRRGGLNAGPPQGVGVHLSSPIGGDLIAPEKRGETPRPLKPGGVKRGGQVP